MLWPLAEDRSSEKRGTNDESACDEWGVTPALTRADQLFDCSAWLDLVSPGMPVGDRSKERYLLVDVDAHWHRLDHPTSSGST
jgi:hypothetical protein